MRVHGERVCAYGRGRVCVHGEMEDVYMEGVGCVHREESSVHAWREDVCIWKG